jgi:hypothetical protein
MNKNALARRIGRGAARRSSRLLLGVVAVAAGMMFVLAGVSFAYWGTTDSSHPAVAAAGTLSAPTGGAQQGNGKPGSVPVSWTAPAGYTPTGYTVLRCTGSGCTSFAPIANGNCSGTISATSCTDTDSTLAAGTTYSYEVQAQFDNWVSAAGSPFTAATSAVTSLTFTSQPASGQNIQATGTGTFAVSVAIQDAKGVVATNDNTDTVTLAIASGDNPGGGTLTCTGGLTATASSGVASFTGCAITKAGNGYQLTASSATDPSLTSPANANSFDITAGTLAKYGVQVAGPVTAGTAAAVTLTAQDANGNTVTSYNLNKQPITWSGPTNSPNTTAPTLPAGKVSFQNGLSTTSLTVTLTDAGQQTLTATDGSSNTGSATVTVTGAAPVSLTLASCVAGGSAASCAAATFHLGGSGGTMTADVQALDQYGNAATITTPITMTVTSGNTSQFTVVPSALTIDGTATPSDQSTQALTVTQDGNGNSAITITIHVTSAQPIADFTFNVKK